MSCFNKRRNSKERGNKIPTSVVLRETPSRAPKVGRCLTRKELSEKKCAVRRKRLYWNWHPGGEQQGKGTQENCSATWLAVLGLWWWDPSPGCLWPIILTQESFLVVHSLLSQDGCQQQRFWEVVRHVVSPFDFSPTPPVGGGLLVPCSLPGPPVKRQSMQVVTMVPGQDGRFQSACFP